MIIQLFSDLHLRDLDDVPPIMEGVDVVVVAGDLCPYRQGVIDRMADLWNGSDIVYVAGNHEFYSHDMVEAHALLGESCRKAGIHYLHRDSVDIDGIRFIGSTLWTDFGLYAGADESRVINAMFFAKEKINDFRGYILHRRGNHLGWFSPWVSAELHEQEKAYIVDALAEARNDRIPSVVVTHHAPSLKSVSPKYKGAEINPAFASNMDDVVEQGKALYWFHGHMHDSVNYRIGETMVLSNPRGYNPKENSVGFNPRFSVEIDL